MANATTKISEEVAARLAHCASLHLGLAEDILDGEAAVPHEWSCEEVRRKAADFREIGMACLIGSYALVGESAPTDLVPHTVASNTLGAFRDSVERRMRLIGCDGLIPSYPGDYTIQIIDMRSMHGSAPVYRANIGRFFEELLQQSYEGPDAVLEAMERAKGPYVDLNHGTEEEEE